MLSMQRLVVTLTVLCMAAATIVFTQQRLVAAVTATRGGTGMDAGSHARPAGRESHGRLFHRVTNGLGNQLFKWASAHGIAAAHNMTTCFSTVDLPSVFQGFGPECKLPDPKHKIGTVGVGYAAYYNFPPFDQDTLLEGCLQSWKFFVPHVRSLLRFQPRFQQKADAFLAPYKAAGKVTVGIHVRRGDLLGYGYMHFPSVSYFEGAMEHFRAKYNRGQTAVQFVVATNDVAWCTDSRTKVFNSTTVRDVRVITETHEPGTDLAILAGCDHMIMTVGTFGWWAAFLGAGGKPSGGTVVYYDSEFNMGAAENAGNKMDDYYPPTWTAMGDSLWCRWAGWTRWLDEEGC
jgi:galactoside 2-L-fucosyltransferase 1/2